MQPVSLGSGVEQEDPGFSRVEICLLALVSLSCDCDCMLSPSGVFLSTFVEGEPWSTSQHFPPRIVTLWGYGRKVYEQSLEKPRGSFPISISGCSVYGSTQGSLSSARASPSVAFAQCWMLIWDSCLRLCCSLSYCGFQMLWPFLHQLLRTAGERTCSSIRPLSLEPLAE